MTRVAVGVGKGAGNGMKVAVKVGQGVLVGGAPLSILSPSDTTLNREISTI